MPTLVTPPDTAPVNPAVSSPARWLGGLAAVALALACNHTRAEEYSIDGLFAPRLKLHGEPLQLQANPSPPVTITPEPVLQQVPTALGEVLAPAAESAGVPDPVWIQDNWVFSTPADRIALLKNTYASPTQVVRAMPRSLSRTEHLQTEDIPHDYWLESARLQKLPVEALYAVALQESGMRTASGQVQPWPWTLNCNAPCPHGPMRFASKQAASLALEKLLKAGWRNIDIGAMQVNYRAHARRFAAYDLLDPRINVIVGGVILRESVQQAGGHLKKGYALYHVGSVQADNRDRANQYAANVGRWMDRIRKSGELSVARSAAYPD